LRNKNNGFIGLYAYQPPPPRGGLLVIRHSERYSILSDEEAYTAPLTEKGKIMAHELGMVLAATHHIGEVVSSPVYRCIQTAEEIIRGSASGSVQPVIRMVPLLHFDLSLARVDDLSTMYLDDLTTRQLLTYPESKAHIDLADALLAELPFPKEPGVLNVAVTHDTVVSFLYGHFCSPTKNYNFSYPGFLEGFYLVKTNGKVELLR
jgi:broad specificity phosphatase PhoE